MQLIKRNIPNVGYEQFDVVAIADDAHQWSPMELSGNFLFEINVTLTDAEKKKLIMVDEGLSNYSAISQLPAFRSLSTKQENLKVFHRRKYIHDGGVKLKANAGER